MVTKVAWLGCSHGSTDEFGYFTQRNKGHMHDLHATILHQLWPNHEQLIYPHLGCDFHLTDVEGSVVKDILV